MKKQIVVIHGGNVFRTRKEYLRHLRNYKLDFERLTTSGWKENLRGKLGKNFEVVLLKMPNPWTARYAEWEIMFKKVFSFLSKNPLLVGHSLGGIFLAKYLSLNIFPKKIRAAILVAAPYDKKSIDARYSLGDFALPKSLSRFEKQCGNIFIYQSTDDPVVPFVDAKKYQKALPTAKAILFKNKGHFGQSAFPELVAHIKKLFR